MGAQESLAVKEWEIATPPFVWPILMPEPSSVWNPFTGPTYCAFAGLYEKRPDIGRLECMASLWYGNHRRQVRAIIVKRRSSRRLRSKLNAYLAA